MYGYPSCGFAFYREYIIFDFVFAFWYDKALSYWGLLLRKRICSYGIKPFPLKSHILKMEATKIHTTAAP